MTCKFVSTLFFCLILSGNLPGIAADGDISSAIEKFKSGKYAEALDLFATAKYNIDRAAEVHYYKACCLTKLNRRDESIKEYKLAKLLDKTGKVAPLAAQALQAYGESTVTDKAVAASNAAAASASVDPPSYKDCAKRITSQAEERINKIWGESKAPRSGGFTPLAFPGRGFPPMPGFGPPPGFDNLGRRYKFYQYPPGGGRSNPYLSSPEYAYHKQRAKNLADAADGLVSLLTRPDDGKGVYLIPQGTNLYVRNYEFGSSIDPVLQPMKTDMKMWSAKRLPPGALVPAAPQVVPGAAAGESSSPSAELPDNVTAPNVVPAVNSNSKSGETGSGNSAAPPLAASAADDLNEPTGLAPRVVQPANATKGGEGRPVGGAANSASGAQPAPQANTAAQKTEPVSASQPLTKNGAKYPAKTR